MADSGNNFKADMILALAGQQSHLSAAIMEHDVVPLEWRGLVERDYDTFV